MAEHFAGWVGCTQEGLRVENRSIGAWIQTNTANRRDWILLLGSQGNDGLKRCRVRNQFIRRRLQTVSKEKWAENHRRDIVTNNTLHSRSTAVFHIHSFISVRQLQ